MTSRREPQFSASRGEGQHAPLFFDSVTVGPFTENTWVLGDTEAGAGVLVDPGDEPDRVLDLVERSGLTIEAIWLTHAHIDHVGAIAGVRRAIPGIPIHLHPADEPLYRNAHRQAAAYGLPFDAPPATDRALSDEQSLTVGQFTFRVLHVPGHAPGHVVFLTDGLCFGGDLLFAGSIGRTDLPLSNPRDMAASLARIAALPPDTRVLPGHGPPTTIGEELRSNPFLTGEALVPGARA